MASILTAEDLSNIKHTVLTIERQEIARNIEPSRFFGHLRAKYIFDERDCDEIRGVSSRVGSAEVFVDTLKRKGSRGYDEFCNALMSDKTQMFLLQRLTQTLELLRVKVIEKKKLKLEQLQKASLFQPHHPLDSLQHSSHTSVPPSALTGSPQQPPHGTSGGSIVQPPSSHQQLPLHALNGGGGPNTHYNGIHQPNTIAGPSGKPSSVQFTQLPLQHTTNYPSSPGQQRHYSNPSDQYAHNHYPQYKKMQSRQITSGNQFIPSPPQPMDTMSTMTQSRGTLVSPTAMSPSSAIMSPQYPPMYHNRSQGHDGVDHSAPTGPLGAPRNPPQTYSPSHYQLSPVRSPGSYEQSPILWPTPQDQQPQQYHYNNDQRAMSPYRSGEGGYAAVSEVPHHMSSNSCGHDQVMPMMPTSVMDPAEQPCGQVVLARSSN